MTGKKFSRRGLLWPPDEIYFKLEDMKDEKKDPGGSKRRAEWTFLEAA